MGDFILDEKMETRVLLCVWKGALKLIGRNLSQPVITRCASFPYSFSGTLTNFGVTS